MSDAATAATPAVHLDQVTLRYPGTPQPAVEDFSLDVARGTGVVLTGAQGAGKSAVVRALVGLLPPMNGVMEVLGLPATDPSLRARVGYCPERRPFMPRLRVREVTATVAGVRGLGPAAAAAALRAAGLPPGDPRMVGGLETGDVRRLALACALVGDPDVLVLDDPWEFPETVDALRAALARGAAVVVATPDPGGFPDVVGPLITLPGGGDDEEDDG